MITTTLLPILQSFAGGWSQQPLQEGTQISFTAFDTVKEHVTVDTNSSSHLAAPKFAAGVNASTGEQWAFDATSSDGTSGLLVGIYHDPTYAFLGPGNLRISIDAVWSNGTTWSFVDYLERADLYTDESGTSGTWSKRNGTSAYDFFVSTNNSYATLTFDVPEITGRIVYEATVPSRYPSGSTARGSSTFNAPAVEWVEIIPAARSTVDLTLGKTPLKWQGIGGAERWWGSRGWLDAFQGWTAMRAVVGPYVLTYWAPKSRLDAGVLYPSAFLARNGKRVFSTTRSGPSIGADAGNPYIEYRGLTNQSTISGSAGHFGSNKAGAVHGYVVSLVNPSEDLRWEFFLTHKNMEFSFDLGDDNGGVAYVGTARGGQLGDDVYDGVFFNEWVDVTDLKVPKIYTVGASMFYRVKAALFGH